MKLKSKTAKIILSNRKKLGKKIYFWKVPRDLLDLAKKYKKTFVGIGRWLNTKEKFVCIATPNYLFYIEKELLKEINQAFRKGSV